MLKLMHFLSKRITTRVLIGFKDSDPSFNVSAKYLARSTPNYELYDSIELLLKLQVCSAEKISIFHAIAKY